MNNLINDEKHYVTLNNYLRAEYNKKVFKISLNGNFTCPNRDGTISYKGCTFCSASGSGDFSGPKEKSFKEQFEIILAKMNEKWHEGYYIAYLQANTNTYDSIENLKKKYYEIINLDPNIKIFSIATRPDCINLENVQLLSEINKKTKIWVELGFQTANETTSKLINRGYDNQIFLNAIKLLNEYGIETIVHIINGLPYETKEDMLNTVMFLNKLPISGIKIHMLHIMKNTPLCNEYLLNQFHILSLEEYVDITVEQIRRLNETIVIHRLTGDSPKELLVEPLWTLKKFVVINEIDKLMRKNNYYQGDLVKIDNEKNIE